VTRREDDLRDEREIGDTAAARLVRRQESYAGSKAAGCADTAAGSRAAHGMGPL
jgi:hypothetical protein